MCLRLTFALLCVSLSAGLAAAPYTLGPGDVLQIKVVNFENLSTQVTVQPDGRISLPLVGSVEAAGRSAETLAGELTTRFSEFVVKPSVWVTVTQFREQSIFILGLVKGPGKAAVTPGMTILTAIASVGGTAEKADAANVLVTRDNRETFTVDLEAAARDPKRNIELQPGDIIHVPESRDRVLVAGSVASPGSYDLKPGMRVLDALAAAGGITADANASASVLTGATGSQAKVNLESLLKRGEVAENVELKAGDVLLIPKQEKRFFVFGEVGKPGVYPLNGEERVLDALSVAGGTASTAKLSEVSVVRMVEGKATALKVNLDDFAKKGDQAQNLRLEPADVLFVPEKSQKRPMDTLGLFQLVSNALLLFDRL